MLSFARDDFIFFMRLLSYCVLFLFFFINLIYVSIF